MIRRLLLCSLCFFPGIGSGGLSAQTLPADGETPLFSRHVAAVFSRAGCNAGTCHGAVQGRNGFRLTLFGGDTESDYDHLVHGSRGRRINLAAPESSLLLRKATARVPHGGGAVVAPGSLEYQILHQWIAAGAVRDRVEDSALSRLVVAPAEHTLRRGDSVQLQVHAEFADGTREDVTRLCSFQSLEPAVASVDRNGVVRAEEVGDAALVVRYRSDPVVVMVLVPRSAEETFAQPRPHNFIDEHVLAKLEQLNLPAAPLADDETFLRRARLDVTGQLPAPEEIRAFLADTDPDKRRKKIDELLDEPGYAALWALKFCDLLKASEFGVYADGLKLEDDAQRFHQWVRARLEENIPYDEFAERILTATSREGRSVDAWVEEVLAIAEGSDAERTDVEIYSRRNTLDLYWQRGSASGLPGSLQTAHAFLGLQLECAQCHRHPHDVWQQDDLLSFANFFARVRRPGFQGSNEKNYPETAEVYKKLGAEAKELAERAKQLKETRGKELQTELQEAKAQGDHDRAKQLEAEAEKFRGEVAAMERRGNKLSEVSKRVLHAEVMHLAEGDRFASITNPLGTQTSKQFRLLGESEPVEIAADEDPRPRLVAWMRQRDNPFFAKAIVNRVWAHYLGRGLVDPPDNLSPLNPASHPGLLEDLQRGFIEHGYDLKWLHRTILASRTYQQSSDPPAASQVDRGNYAYFYYRRLPAEVLIDALNQATLTAEDMDMKYHRWPEEIKTVEIPYAPRNTFVTFMLEQFGRPQRSSSVQCDCERTSDSSILQVLSLANHPRILEKISDPAGQAARIAGEISEPGLQIEELFLCTVSRRPTEEEARACLEHLEQAASPQEGLQAILWGLLNSREFLLQH